MAALFLLLAAAALSVILLRPVCEAAFGHKPLAQHPAACCESVEDGELDIADLAPPGPGAKPVGASFAYAMGAALMASATVFFKSAPATTRSYYSRSARILR